MKVLVTGGNGFIGQYVCEYLEKKGHEPLVMDHHRGTAPKYEVFLADVRDATAVTEAVAHVDGIIHLAAVLGTQETITNPRPAAETNVLGALNIFEAANQYDVPTVYAGGGNHWMRSEGTGAYTISKTAAEDFVRMHVKYRGSRISIVRPVNAYGPRQSIAKPYGTSRVRKIMPAFTCRALTGTDIEIYGDGAQISDCVWVGDVAEAFVRSLVYTDLHGPLPVPIEVGPTESCTVAEVAQYVASQAASLTGLHPVGTRFLPMRPGEVPNAVVSSDTSTLSHIGMMPERMVPLEAGIRTTVKWYKENWLPGFEGSSV